MISNLRYAALVSVSTRLPQLARPRVFGRTRCSAPWPHLKPDILRALQIRHDLEEITGGRVAIRAKHLVKRFHMNLGVRPAAGILRRR